MMYFTAFGKPLWRKALKAIAMNFAFGLGEGLASEIIIPFLKNKSEEKEKKLKRQLKKLKKQIRELRDQFTATTTQNLV